MVLDARNENSDFGATSTLFLSAENGVGVNAEKYTWVQGSRLPGAYGLVSYAEAWPAVPQTPTATTSRRRFRRLTIGLSIMVVDD